jgi:hypothetical protein
VFGHWQYLGLIEVAKMVYFIYSLVYGPILFGFVVPFVPIIILFQVCCSFFFFFWFVVPFRVCCLGLEKSLIFLTLFVVASGS